MTIALPAELEKQISREEAALHLAIGLFADDRVTLGQAATIAGILLAKSRGQIPAVKDLLSDLQTKAGFYIEAALVQMALKSAGE